MFTTSFTLVLNFTPKPLTVGLALVIVCVCVCVCVCVTEKVSLHCVWSKQELFTSLEEISRVYMPRQQPKEEEAQYRL